EQFTKVIKKYGDSLNDLDEYGLINLSSHLESLLPKDDGPGNGCEEPESEPETTDPTIWQESESEFDSPSAAAPTSAAYEIGLGGHTSQSTFGTKAEALAFVKEHFAKLGLSSMEQAQWFGKHGWEPKATSAQSFTILQDAALPLAREAASV
ncbi:MAG: hypothetical protein WCL39_13000, partial [Armatimonadota bacterium]